MSIGLIRETGDASEPLPVALVELQQIVLGLFFIWDVLGDGYAMQELAEQAILSDWARKHKFSRKLAIEALVSVKEKFIAQPFCVYVHVRDFKGEGWADMLMFSPRNNQDVLDQIALIHQSRPFKETPPTPPL